MPILYIDEDERYPVYTCHTSDEAACAHSFMIEPELYERILKAQEEYNAIQDVLEGIYLQIRCRKRDNIEYEINAHSVQIDF